jgi:hypothetical protein
MKKLLFAIALTAAFTSCKKDDKQPVAGVFKGKEAKFQHGKAWTWAEMDNEGKPVRLGISIDEAAMNSLDTSHPGGDGGHHHVNALSLDFPSRNADVPFQHAMIDWNPFGHEPVGLYDKPHFDFHFYLTSEAERMSIPLYEQDSMKFKNLPDVAYMPGTYIPIPGGVPQMGVHWIDFTSGEFNGQGFTQTFIYGSYNGKVTFYEPMITKQFIDNNPTYERAIPVPAKFQKTGYYPTKFKMNRVNGALNITLENFVYRTQS